MDTDFIVNLADDINTQIPLLLKLISWWKYMAIIFIIATVIEAIYIIYIYFYRLNEKSTS